MRLLAEKGLTLDEVIAVAEANEPPAPEPEPSKAALRTKRWRERKASQSVTETSRGDAGQTVTSDAKTVTNRHGVTPLARVEDNLLEVIPLEAVAAAVVEPSVTLWPD